jgi:hypothetical protein
MRCEPGLRLSLAFALSIGATALLAQTPQTTPPQTPPPTAGQPPSKPAQPAGTTGRPRPTATPDARLGLTVMVTASDGKTLPGVSVRASGPVERTGETDSSGLTTFTNMTAGTYRLHFEHESFVTFEKEAVVGPGKPLRLSVTLMAAPPPPPKPEPEPAAPPPPPPPNGSDSPSTTSIPDFIESNYIGGAPVKRSPVGCAGNTTATLVQTKDPVAEHVHADADETIYVVAGEGTHRIGGRESAVAAGTFVVVPRGTPHSLTRRGSRPLIFVATLAGPACQPAK